MKTKEFKMTPELDRRMRILINYAIDRVLEEEKTDHLQSRNESSNVKLWGDDNDRTRT